MKNMQFRRNLGEMISRAIPKQIDSHTKDPLSTKPRKLDFEDLDLDSGTEVPEHEHPTYKQLIMIHAGKLRGGALKDALAVGGEEVKQVSLSEPQLEKLTKEYPLEPIRFTKQNILRIYPYELRLNSSNYNPLVAWSHGAQMVALNMQGYGRPLWLVQGFFRANGGSAERLSRSTDPQRDCRDPQIE
ncbi:hypothetical protein O6H91_13G035100 [Diphasiastrum complanatum]|uniref:Uncharacterized protein n=1 Tax=Diphasiastrum complanatum TaxID=34168 RepID=A0ACC2BU38_DIPCM|nr:hypothetical protein O6H91_13G035100 [Diphasiastrum complanatum]